MTRYIVIIVALFFIPQPVVAWWVQLGVVNNKDSQECAGSVCLDFEGSVDGSTYTFGDGDYAASGATTAMLSSDFIITACPAGFGSGNCGHHVNGYDKFYFSTSADQDVSDEAGTIEIDFRYHTWANNAVIFTGYYDTSENQIKIYMYNDDEIRFHYEGNNDRIILTTSGADLVADNNYHIIAKWTQLDVDPNLYIEVNSISESDNTNITPFASNATTCMSGTPSGNYPADFYIDNIKIYTSWN